MSLIHTDLNRAPAFTLHHMLDRIHVLAADLYAGLQARRQQADLRLQLDGMDDHLLSDIGLKPREVRSWLTKGYEEFDTEFRRR